MRPNLYLLPTSAPIPQAQAPARYLPIPPTPLLGREGEVAAAKSALAQPDMRLITLLGPGGVGKTRLSLQVALDLAEAFNGEVYFVQLAPITEPELVISTVAQVLDVQDHDGTLALPLLKSRLQREPTLLVLDNFEQVLSAATLVADLLASCPQLKALVTSRAPLAIRGEHEFPVSPLPLPVPSSEGVTLANISGNAAMMLFEQRARAVRPDFSIVEGNVSDVAEICRRLDGLPLAIELVAARARILSPAAMLARLTKRLQLLTGGARDLPERHQTLRSAIQWSYDLLTEEEQQLFRQLGVFSGGFTLEAASEVAGFSSDSLGEAQSFEALEGVESLLSKSLLWRNEHDNELRFGMLETVREFALDLLNSNPIEAHATYSQHALYYTALAERAAPALRGPDQIVWNQILEREHDNLRAALNWSLSQGAAGSGQEAGGSVDNPQSAIRNSQYESGAALAMRIGAALHQFWQEQSHISEGRRWLRQAVTHPGAPQEGRERASALYALAWLAACQMDLDAALAPFNESLDMFRKLGDEYEITRALSGLGRISLDSGKLDEAEGYYSEALEIRRRSGVPNAIANALNNLGLVAMKKGDLTHAATLLEEAVLLIKCAGDTSRTGLMVNNLARVKIKQGNWAQAKSLTLESLSIQATVAYKWGIGYCLFGLAEIALSQRQPERAAHLLGAADSIFADVTARMDPSDRKQYEQCIEDARLRLGDEAYSAYWAEGRSAGWEAVVAMPEMEAPSQQEAAPTAHALLSARELEVLRLLAEGISDIQIAERLFLSKHTINAHLRNVYSKLGVTSRAAATRYATDNGLI